MDDKWYYLGIYDDDGLRLQVSIRGKKIRAMVYGSDNTEGIGGNAL
jgi:hypothetical protein